MLRPTAEEAHRRERCVSLVGWRCIDRLQHEKNPSVFKEKYEGAIARPCGLVAMIWCNCSLTPVSILSHVGWPWDTLCARWPVLDLEYSHRDAVPLNKIITSAQTSLLNMKGKSWNWDGAEASRVMTSLFLHKPQPWPLTTMKGGYGIFLRRKKILMCQK